MYKSLAAQGFQALRLPLRLCYAFFLGVTVKGSKWKLSTIVIQGGEDSEFRLDLILGRFAFVHIVIVQGVCLFG